MTDLHKTSQKFRTKIAHHFSPNDFINFRLSRSADWEKGKVKKYDREAREYLILAEDGKEKWIVDDKDYIRKFLFEPEVPGRDMMFDEFLAGSEGLSEEEGREIFDEVFDQRDKDEADELEREMANLIPFRRSASILEDEDEEDNFDPWDDEPLEDEELDRLEALYRALLSKQERKNPRSIDNHKFAAMEDESSEEVRREKLRQLMTEYKGLENSVYEEDDEFGDLLAGFSQRVKENPSNELDDFEDESLVFDKFAGSNSKYIRFAPYELVDLFDNLGFKDSWHQFTPLTEEEYEKVALLESLVRAAHSYWTGKGKYNDWCYFPEIEREFTEKSFREFIKEKTMLVYEQVKNRHIINHRNNLKDNYGHRSSFELEGDKRYIEDLKTKNKILNNDWGDNE